MQFIKLNVNHPLEDGMDIIFDAPCNCPEVAGLAIFYNNTRSVFTFRDAHKNDLSELPSFTAGARIKVNLDTVNGYAYLQNADTNAYLEMMFKNRLPAIESAEHPGCYCRTVDGETEWINPPMKYGIEYRTTERLAGEPVYVQRYQLTISPGSSHTIELPNGSKQITIESVQHIMGNFLIDPNVTGVKVPTVTVTPFTTASPPMIVLSVDSNESKSATVVIVIKYTKV